MVLYCGNNYAAESLRRCMDRLKRAYAQFYWDDPDGAHFSMDTRNHEIILQALRKKDAVALEKALPFITSNVARALELYPRKGCIAEGSDADLVLLDEGYQIDTVLAKGRIMMQDKQVLVKGTFE